MPDRPSLRPQHVPPRPLAGVAQLLRQHVRGRNDVMVGGITHDSRLVRPGDLYAALPGANVHGAAFVAQAAAAGAVAVLTDSAGADAAAHDLPVVVVTDPRAQLGRVAAYVYGEPARDLLMLGITGTNGKTTTAYLVQSGLTAAGHRAGLVGTIETRVGDEHFASVRTTPEATDLHALLAAMRERGATACVMEVSSHALVLGRVDGIIFDVVGFTNLSQDHLDFHADLEDYFAAKAALFTPQRARRGVVVVDDEYGRRLAAGAGVAITTVSTRGAADWQVAVGDPGDAEPGRVTLANTGSDRLVVSSPIPGAFNVANVALAVVMLDAAGVDRRDAARGVGACPGVPGRMERVRLLGRPAPLAVVDYAHTPDAIENVLRALRPATRGRLVVVVGAGGDRDPHKRLAMGAAAARNADVVVVTDDNPRSEDPAAIRAAVVAGARGAVAGTGVEVREVADRRSAIKTAVEAVGGVTGTVVVVGKGHEQGQEVRGVVHPFDDRVVLRDALERVLASAQRTRR